MNPGFYIDETAYQPGRTIVDVDFTGGSAGSVGSIGNKAGITGIAHGSTGQYTITLVDNVFGFLSMVQNIIQDTYAKTGACKVEITADNTADPATKTLVLLVVDAAGDAVDLASGDKVLLTLNFQRYGSR